MVFKTWDIKTLTELVFKEYVNNGFFDRWEDVKPYVFGIILETFFIDLEISETVEKIRKFGFYKKHGCSEQIKEEFADIAIRLFNLCKRLDIDLEKAILDKHKKNLSRKYLHNNKVI